MIPTMKPALSVDHFQNEAAAFEYVEAKLWPNGPVCVHCKGANRIGKLNGKTTRPGLYKCYACRKPFTVRIGTVFESSHVPLRFWLQAIYLTNSSKKSISIRQLQRIFGGSMKTAWSLSRRIPEAIKTLDVTLMGGEGGIVEFDVELDLHPVDLIQQCRTAGLAGRCVEVTTRLVQSCTLKE